MAITGPIPKRSDQLIRRNITDPIDKVTAIGPVYTPTLGMTGEVHPLVRDFWDSLKVSAQNKFYEPSDWQFARITLHFLNDLLLSSRPSSQMLASVNQMLSLLLVTEGDRRRVRIEVERNLGGGEAKVMQVADLFRQRLEEAT
jgi:hypothetical protein